jgi:putative cell wall-binding protein
MASSSTFRRAVAGGFLIVAVVAGPTAAAPQHNLTTQSQASNATQLHGNKLTAARHTRVNVRDTAKASARRQPDRQSAGPAPKGSGIAPKPQVVSTTSVLAPPTVATFSATPDVSSVGFAGASTDTLPCGSVTCTQGARDGIAVGPFDVVQSTSVGFRFADRNGYVPFDLTYADFAGLGFSSGAADGRIVYDTAHQRWIAAFVEWDCTAGAHEGFLDIAISDTTDPQYFWDIWSVSLGQNVPVTPSIGTSSDKIVVAAGVSSIGSSGLPCFSFAGNTTSPDSSLYVIDWTTILGLPGTLPIFAMAPELFQSPLRMAVVEGGPTTASVYGLDITGVLGTPTRLVTITGSATAPVATPLDLTAGGVLQLDHAPLGLARVGTDLATVSETTCTPSGASTPLGCVRLSRFNASGAALVEDLAIGKNGSNDVAPALAVAGDGTIHVVYDESPSGGGAGVSSWAFHKASGAPAGQVSQPALIASGTNTYVGHAPGGVTGLSPDPSDSHAVWQAQEYAGDPSGGWTTWISKLTTGVAASPAGTLTVEAGRPATHSLAVHLSAIAASGTQLLVSNSPTLASGTLASARIVQPTRDARWKLDDSATGGSNATGTRHVYVQVGDGAGAWSAVIDKAIEYPGAPAVIRRSGATRYDTAAAVATNEYSPHVDIAYVATGLNFPDALAGAGAAGHNQGPILLVTPNLPIPSGTAAALNFLLPDHIVVLGGTGVVSEAVKAKLRDYSPDVNRISGASRYATAAAISAATYTPGVEEVLIATGGNFPDALAGAAVAGKQGDPLLLVTASSIPAPTAAELTRLHPHRITILGGTGAVGSAVSNALHSYTDGGVFRVSGPDRFSTAAFIAETYFLPQPTVALAATGYNFPDALAGAALAGRLWSPILLVAPASLPNPTKSALDYLEPPEIDVLGGTGAVSNGVATSLGGYIVP